MIIHSINVELEAIFIHYDSMSIFNRFNSLLDSRKNRKLYCKVNKVFQIDKNPTLLIKFQTNI